MGRSRGDEKLFEGLVQKITREEVYDLLNTVTNLRIPYNGTMFCPRANIQLFKM